MKKIVSAFFNNYYKLIIILKDTPIIPAKTAIKSLRDSGYKNCAAAISRINR